MELGTHASSFNATEGEMTQEIPVTTVGTDTPLAGSPAKAVASAWSLLSGPGVVWFSNVAIPTSTLKFSAPGTYPLQLAATNVNGESNRTLSVTVTGTSMTPIEVWRQSHFNNQVNTGPGLDTADADLDGVSNLMEYATKMNPALNDLIPQAVTRNGANLEFFYTKNKAATDVTCTVEWSDTLLSDWSTAGLSAPTIFSDNGSTQEIRVSVPAGAGVTKRFVHLEVTRP